MAPPARQRGRRRDHDDGWSIALTLDNIEQSELTASQREVLAQAAEASKRAWELAPTSTIG